ncbi:MAG: NAD(P)/FAD-dependent oxidoreductase [Saprospiraceae bacterium]|nr:FAD-dependent monooxygenase [Lewinella sp.]
MKDTRILIVGAGIAGLTTAALLRQRGFQPVIIEREEKSSFNTTGYMLGLLPLGGRVLNELELVSNYFDHSVEMNSYEIHQKDGTLIKKFPLDFINRQYGSYRGISRTELIDLLLEKVDVAQLRYGITIEQLDLGENSVGVHFSNGQTEVFDLVIVADGLHSSTRKLFLNDSEYRYYDTGWGGWVAWMDESMGNVYKEFWGASSFMGLYPVKDRVGIFIGGPNESLKQKGRTDFIDDVRSHIAPGYDWLHRALNALEEDDEPYYWEFHDCETEVWTRGNIVLLGDAAAGFLPTAGVGASMAMDAASTLVDELSRTDKEHLAYGLKLYVNRQRQRTERAQKDSRKLAKMMFVRADLLAGLRDYAVRFYSIKSLASGLSNIMEGA